MKVESEKETSTQKRSGYIVAIIAAFSLGLGVTGTMMWLGKQPQSSVVVASGVPSSKVEVSEKMGLNVPGLRIPANGQDHSPPAQLTAGMSARQTALKVPKRPAH
jgi:hypothetical protein